MLTCIPQSFFGMDYDILGATAGPANLSFKLLSEQGGISLGGANYTVRKNGWLNRNWSLELNGKTCGEACMPSVFHRSFEIRASTKLFVLRAQSVFTRCYDIRAGDSTVGTIRPTHPFTNRAVIDCLAVVPEQIQLFSFWLVVVTWRRSTQAS